ncbi:AhpD-like protein [Aspergillus cavernicola]|uniref:AhpD-like protein n=1 Tax=Aspergillus cavernicola TaxID=176166 RepID=A0ABR4J2Y5_9EURO
MRLPYIPNPPTPQTPTEAEILSRILARRAPSTLLPLDRALLHSYPVADGWNTFLNAIRTQTSLSPVLRELIICRVAILNKAQFEWDHHAPLLVEAGVKDCVLDVLRGESVDYLQMVTDGVISVEESVVLRYTDAMTTDVRVSDEVFDAVRGCFCDRDVIEITATVAAYNCVSRFLVALDVGENNG